MFAGFFAGFVLLAVFLGRFVGRRIVSPIRALVDAVERGASTLPLTDRKDELGVLARALDAHTTELREFLDHELDEQLRSKAVLVCATSDRSSMERARAAFTATALAEGYRRKGLRVLLLLGKKAFGC